MASRLKIGRAELAWPVLQIGQLRFAFSSERTASMLSPSASGSMSVSMLPSSSMLRTANRAEPSKPKPRISGSR